MSAPATRHTHPLVYRKAVADCRALTVTAILSYPCHDLAGDFVTLDGLDFASHQADPWIDLEHAGRCVAWARKSLSRPGSPYSVEWKSLTLDDGTTHRLPVGTSHFNPADRLSSQVFALIESDALPGVSLEFRPVPGFVKSLGRRSPIEPRDAMEFTRADVVRWTHCATPVNEGALTVTKSFGTRVPPALAKVLADNRVGTEALHPTIRKALAVYAPPKTTAVRVEKAMPDDTSVYDAPAATDPAATTDPAPESTEDAPALGGIAALYAKAQALLDACDQNETDMESSDSPELRKFATKMREKISAIAEEIKGMADKHDSKLNGDSEAKEDSAESEGESEEDEPDEPDMETDDEGMLKAIRPAYKPILKALRVKRFSLSEVTKAGVVTPKPDPTTGEADADAKRLERARRKFLRAQRIYG